MAVKRPIELNREHEVEKLISKGALVKEDEKAEEISRINLRMSTSMLMKIDEALNERVGISRNGWILEAIDEKLKKQKESVTK